MTVPATSRRAGPYTGNGVTLTFPFSFKIFSAADIRVDLATAAGVASVGVLNTDYTVSVNVDQTTTPGGTVSYAVAGVVTALPTGYTLAITGSRAYSQTTTLPTGGAYQASVVEAALDSLEMQVQQLDNKTSRALTLSPLAPATTDTTLPAPAANKLIAWNQTATGLQNLDGATLASVVAFGTAASDQFTGTGAQTAFTLTSNPGALNNLRVAVGGVVQRPTTDYTWTSGTTLTFTTAPPAGASILVQYMQALPQGTADWNSLTSRPIVDVKKFGAVGNGSTNDIAAFVAAAAALTDNSSLFIPDGDYVFDFSGYSVGTPTYPSQGIINLSGRTGVRIFGKGAKLRITNLDTRTKGGWSIFWLSECSDIVIEGLKLDVRGVTGLDVAAASPAYPIISAIGTIGTTWRNLTIRDCEITSFNPLGADNNSVSSTLFQYKQIPVFAQGDSAADTVRGLRIVDCVFRSINTYKIFYLGVGGVEIRGNKFLDTAGTFPAIRALIHASRGHAVVGNHFEGLKPADDVPANNIQSTDLPTMVWFTNATNKGGGGVTISANTFALTGSGGIFVGDCSGATISGNTFWDRADMSAKFLVEDETKSCIRLSDEATGSGSFPARDVAVTGNVVSGTVLRKIVQITHALDGVVSSNIFESAAGYGIKAARARRFTIANNTVLGVTLFGGTQEGIFVNTGTGVVADTEPVAVVNNTVSGSAGNAVSTASYTATRLKLSNNRAVGGITPKTAGAQDQLATDFLTFSNDATRVSASGSDLDWYEEGTFTPTIIGTSTAGTGTYTTQIGHFTRIGDTVSFDITITWTAHTGTGNTEVGGLPYASRNTANKISPVSIMQSGGPAPGAGLMRIAAIFANTTRVALREYNPATAAVTNSNAITASGTLYISGVYRV